MFRFFADESCTRQDNVAALSPAVQRHVKAARIAPEEEFILVFSAEGAAWRARLDPEKKGRALLGECIALVGTGPVAIELCIGLSKMDALEAAVSAAAELGATSVRLLVCERSPVRELSANKKERLARIAVSGAEVAGRASAPDILGPTPLSELELDPNNAGFVFWEEDAAEGRSFPAVLKNQTPAKAARLVIGPEGGLSAAEVERLESAGFVRASLGPRILRARTAPLVALALIQSSWGDLR